MAISSTTNDKITGALMTVYLPYLLVQLNEKSGPLIKAIEASTFPVNPAPPRDLVFIMQYGRSGGIGARDEMDDLPEASSRLYRQGKANIKTLAGTIQLTEKLIRGTKNNPAALASELSTQMKNLVTDLKDYLARNIVNGSSGIYGNVGTAVAASAVIPIAGNIEGFYEGQVIDILTPGTPPVYAAQGIEIITVDRVNKTITVSIPVTAAANDGITIHDSYTKELTGMNEIMTLDNVLFGVDRSVYKYFNPIMYNRSSGGSPSPFEPLWLKKALNDVEDRSSEPEAPKFFVCSRGVDMAYAESQQIYKSNTEIKRVEGGYDVPTYNGVPVLSDKYWPENSMGLLNMNTFKLARMDDGDDWHWMDRDGSILKQVANKAAYSAHMLRFCELINLNPSANAMIKGIQEVA